ncbi:MAG: VWA domain-containing protein [Clostridia bacterium]|nr:VWA domain-containing protein [Clostridia bacterium]
MKKITAFLLASVLLLSAAACGPKAGNDDTTASSGTGVPVTTVGGSSEGNVTDAPDDTSEPGDEVTTSPEDGTTAAPADTDAPGTAGTPVTTEKPADTTTPGGTTSPADIVMLPTGPVQNWGEFKPPFFNPLGDKELYESVGASGWRSSIEVVSAETNGEIVGRSYFGALYEFVIENEKLTKDWIVYQAEKLGGSVKDGYSEESGKKALSFNLAENETMRLEVIAETDNDWKRTSFSMVEYEVLNEGKTVTVTSTDERVDDERRLFFCLEPEAGKVWSVKMDFDREWDDIEAGLYPSVEFGLTAGKNREYSIGGISSLLSGYGIASGYQSVNYVFDNIPAVDTPIVFTVNFSADFPKDVSVTLTAEKNPVNSRVSYGTEVGEIKLIGGARTDVYALETPYFPYLENYSYDESVTRNEGGDAVIRVPAGFYQLRIGSETIGGPSIRVQNVPVSAGKITVVELPDEMWTTYSTMVSIFGETSAEAGNMEVIKFTDNGETGVLNVIIHDPEERNVLPGNDDFRVKENGVEAVVTGVERVTAPVNVVLCLDTSGSMGENMEAAKNAAIKFVEGLPDDSTVRLISFQGFVTEHPGSTKAEVIAAIRSLKSIGATTLYDATARALGLLGDCENGYVVVFSDGDDSREPGIAGDGSSITSEEMFALIEASGKTVLTIGFGSGFNPYILDEMARLSVGGGYFVAADASELEAAFSGVASKFGNQFIITYERPLVTVNLNSDVPVVSMMMDMSGSMDLDPKDYPGEDVDFRIDKIKSVFHSFVSKLPDKTLTQYSSFTTAAGWYDIRIGEVTTVNKSDIFAAMGQSVAGGGTPIILALKTSIAALSPITSSKKVLVFFTDAALGVDDDDENGSQQYELDNALRQLKALGIRALFVGLGGKDYIAAHEDVFKHAAELSGGDYIITSDAADIQTKLDELLSKIDKPASDKNSLNISLSLDCVVEGGEPMQYSVQYYDENAAPRTRDGDIVVPGTVKITDGGNVK